MELDILQPLLGNADQRTLARHAGEHVFHDRAALVHHDGGTNALPFEPVHDGRTARPVDFFLPGEREIHVLLRHEALANQLFRRLHDAAERPLRIQCSAPPEHAVLHNPLESRLFPLRFLHRYHVIVGHQDGRRVAFLSLPVVEHAVHAVERPLARLVHLRVKARQ